MRFKESVLKLNLFMVHTLQNMYKTISSSKTDSEFYIFLKHKMIAMLEWKEQKHGSVT